MNENKQKNEKKFRKIAYITFAMNFLILFFGAIIFLFQDLIYIIIIGVILSILILILAFLEPKWIIFMKNNIKIKRILIVIYPIPLIIGLFLVTNISHLAIRYLPRELVTSFLLKTIIFSCYCIIWSILNISILYSKGASDEE